MASASGVMSTSPWPIAMFTLSPVRHTPSLHSTRSHHSRFHVAVGTRLGFSEVSGTPVTSLRPHGASWFCMPSSPPNRSRCSQNCAPTL